MLQTHFDSFIYFRKHQISYRRVELHANCKLSDFKLKDGEEIKKKDVLVVQFRILVRKVDFSQAGTKQH